jgi:hypothetical protein
MNWLALSKERKRKILTLIFVIAPLMLIATAYVLWLLVIEYVFPGWRHIMQDTMAFALTKLTLSVLQCSFPARPKAPVP